MKFSKMTLSVLAACLLSVAFASHASAAPQEQIIEIKGYHFVPDKVTVPAGTKITWINRDEAPHTIVEKQKKFRSNALDTNDSYSMTFSDPGDYSYFCSLHPQMVASITVTGK